MNMKLTNGLLGLGALILAGQASAATIDLTPSTVSVIEGEIFSLIVQGNGFDTGFDSGGVRLSWDVAQLEVVSTVANINSSLQSNGLAGINPATSVFVNAGDMGADVFDVFFGIAGPSFNMFTIDFRAIASGPVNISGSTVPGGFQDDLFTSVVVDSFNGATVNVSAVPVPAAAWLFGSGLIGLVGIARRKTQLA